MSDWSSDELEQGLRMEQMRADIRLKDTQAATEWPKVFTQLLVAVAAIFGAMGAWLGYFLAHHSQ